MSSLAKSLIISVLFNLLLALSLSRANEIDTELCARVLNKIHQKNANNMRTDDELLRDAAELVEQETGGQLSDEDRLTYATIIKMQKLNDLEIFERATAAELHSRGITSREGVETYILGFGIGSSEEKQKEQLDFITGILARLQKNIPAEVTVASVEQALKIARTLKMKPRALLPSLQTWSQIQQYPEEIIKLSMLLQILNSDQKTQLVFVDKVAKHLSGWARFKRFFSADPFFDNVTRASTETLAAPAEALQEHQLFTRSMYGYDFIRKKLAAVNDQAQITGISKTGLAWLRTNLNQLSLYEIGYVESYFREPLDSETLSFLNERKSRFLSYERETSDLTSRIAAKQQEKSQLEIELARAENQNRSGETLSDNAFQAALQNLKDQGTTTFLPAIIPQEESAQILIFRAPGYNATDLLHNHNATAEVFNLLRSFDSNYGDKLTETQAETYITFLAATCVNTYKHNARPQQQDNLFRHVIESISNILERRIITAAKITEIHENIIKSIQNSKLNGDKSRLILTAEEELTPTAQNTIVTEAEKSELKQKIQKLETEISELESQKAEVLKQAWELQLRLTTSAKKQSTPIVATKTPTTTSDSVTAESTSDEEEELASVNADVQHMSSSSGQR